MALSNYTVKIDLKEVTGIATSMLASKTDLMSLKTEVDLLDLYKLQRFLTDLSKISNEVDYYLAKITMYDKLTIKINAVGSKIPSTLDFFYKQLVYKYLYSIL